MNPRKIAYVTAIGASAHSFLKGHLVTLRDMGYQTTLICTEDSKAIQTVKETNTKYKKVNFKVDIAPFADCRSLIQLVVTFALLKPKVVHAHMSKAGLLSMIAATMCRIPYRIYHNHGMAYFAARGKKRYLLGTIEKTTCKLATHVIFCSNSTRDKAIEYGLCSTTKALVIGYGTISGVDIERFKRSLSAEEKQKLKRDLGIPENLSLAGFVGRIVPHKGIDTLIQGWRKLPSDTKQTSALVIAGANNSDDLYGRLRKACHSEENIFYLGRRDNVEELYQLFDILILPSTHEGFPYSVLEAQSVGVPAIVTRVTGNIDAIEEQKTGLFVQVDNPAELAYTINALLNDEITRNMMSLEAVSRVNRQFSQDLVLSNLRDFYIDLLQ